MAKVIKLGAGKAKQAPTHAVARTRQKPTMGSAQKASSVAVRNLHYTLPAKGSASSSKAGIHPKLGVRRADEYGPASAAGMGHVETARKRQKTFDGKYSKIALQGKQPAIKQTSGVSSSKALVRPSLRAQSRTDVLKTLAQKVSGVIGAPTLHPFDRTSKPADMAGRTRTVKSTKKTTGGPKVAGPKVTYQKRAAKNVGKKPYILPS